MIYILATLILFVSLLIILRQRKKIEFLIRFITFETYILLFIFLKLPEGTDPLLRFLYSLQIITLDADYSSFFDLFPQSGIYRAILRGLFFLAPVLTLGFIATFIKDFISKIVFSIHRLFHDVYIFSELNRNSIRLAEDIKNKDFKAGILFINVDEDNEFITELKDNNFLKCNYSLEKLIKNPFHEINFLEISDDKDLNLINCLKIIDLYKAKYLEKDLKKKNLKKLKLTKIQIHVFNDNPDSEIILNNKEKYGIDVFLINTAARIAYNLAYEYPYYLGEKNNKASFLLVGAGRVGFEILKTILWCYAINNKEKTFITVVDENADHIKSRFYKEMPGIHQDEFNIEFIKADITTTDFIDKLYLKERQYNYIVVSLGKDSLSIDTAIFLRSFLIANDESFEYRPKIFVNVDNKLKADIISDLKCVPINDFGKQYKIKKNEDFENNYNRFDLIPFGHFNSLYSYNFMVNNILNRMARNVNSYYIQRAYIPEYVKNYQFVSETDRRSSAAFALHMKYKLHNLGYEIIEITEQNYDQSIIDDLNRDIEGHLEKLMIQEQNRFQMFYKCEGWQSASYEEYLIYRDSTKTHKNPIAKKHICICDWDGLAILDSKPDAHFKFQENGRNLVREIPSFLGLNEKQEYNPGNVYFKVEKNK